jgi:precorrin-3B synthase
MASGDGWLVRVRSAAAALRCDQLRGVARLAPLHGNGLIELTRRANLQLRGLQPNRFSQVQAELVAIGLADAKPEREQRPALLVDPLAQIDPACAPLERFAQEIDTVLAASAEACSLSPKFSVAIDGGSGALAGVVADIGIAMRVDAIDQARLSVDGGAGMLTLGTCGSADLAEVLVALTSELAAFASVHGAAPRMRDFVRARGLDALHACVAASLVRTASPEAACSPRSLLGFHGEGRGWFGVGIAFGSAPAHTWAVIADLAERFGDGRIRVTPRRELLLIGVQARDAAHVERAARDLGLITLEADPRARVIACSGAPACASACGETRQLAGALSACAESWLAAGATLHVSGCAKGCAKSASSALTVVLDAGGAHLGVNMDVSGACAVPLVPIDALPERVNQLCAQRTGRP